MKNITKKINIALLHLVGESWERELIDQFFVGNNFSRTFEKKLLYFIRQLLSFQKQEIVEEIEDFLKDQNKKHYSADSIIRHFKGELKQNLIN